MPRISPSIELTDFQSDYLKELKNRRKASKDLSQRAETILLRSEGRSYKTISKLIDLGRHSVSKWCSRWLSAFDDLQIFDSKFIAKDVVSASIYRKEILNILSDSPRSGCPQTITPEQRCLIISLSCHPPDENTAEAGSVWSVRALAREIENQKILTSVSKSWVNNFLKSDGYKTS